MDFFLSSIITSAESVEPTWFTCKCASSAWTDGDLMFGFEFATVGLLSFAGNTGGDPPSQVRLLALFFLIDKISESTSSAKLLVESADSRRIASLLDSFESCNTGGRSRSVLEPLSELLRFRTGLLAGTKAFLSCGSASMMITGIEAGASLSSDLVTDGDGCFCK